MNHSHELPSSITHPVSKPRVFSTVSAQLLWELPCSNMELLQNKLSDIYSFEVIWMLLIKWLYVTSGVKIPGSFFLSIYQRICTL